MLFLIVLTLATLVAAVLPIPGGQRSWRSTARTGMGIAMIFAGISHWAMPEPFEQHLPPWVPAAELLVLLSGLAEVALGAALLVRTPWQRWAGLALAAYLVGVFPANVYVAVAGVNVDGQPGGVYPWLRLPLQALFVAWALWSTGWFSRDPTSARAMAKGPDRSERA